MSLEIFSKNVQYLRNNKGYSQKDLADRLKVTRAAVGAWEEGRAYPQVDVLLQLCDLFKVPIRGALTMDLRYNKPVAKAENGVGVSSQKETGTMLKESVHMLLSHAHQLHPLLNEEERLSDLGKLVKVIADDIESGKISVGNVSASELLNNTPWSFVFKNN